MSLSFLIAALAMLLPGNNAHHLENLPQIPREVIIAAIRAISTLRLANIRLNCSPFASIDDMLANLRLLIRNDNKLRQHSNTLLLMIRHLNWHWVAIRNVLRQTQDPDLTVRRLDVKSAVMCYQVEVELKGAVTVMPEGSLFSAMCVFADIPVSTEDTSKKNSDT